tara:strand:- start:612 stop:983 length:372 start_codon:yes stop_codon:yes gene_type:complete
MLIKVLMVLLMVSMVHAKLHWVTDTPEFTMDKQVHFVGSFGLYFMFQHKGFSKFDSFKYSLYFGLTKELIFDNGISKYDLTYNIIGIGFAYFIDKVWKPKRKHNGNIQYRLGINRVRISYRLR